MCEEKAKQNKDQTKYTCRCITNAIPKLLPLPSHRILQWSLMCCLHLSFKDLEVQSEEQTKLQ